ncbi:MAG: tRNA pseudouridine(55) synthase TruB [Chloroflexi bacterium]|nr:tRNA pseudouridine(55) synthase TruB [Chloroflexota bacterium]MBI3732023.1 tRNA pseudouridine(55) synthase TruB [Chloroflexota bacterium]
MTTSGILNLNKPVGPTSAQMVTALRRLTGIDQIGHTGTLDPLAAGVLPLCVGRAVRLSEYLLHDDKVYQAEITLGVTTATDDGEGEIIAQQPVALTQEQIESALATFTGAQEQVPPQYSAIKVAGRPMYESARRGQVIEARPRRIVIHQIRLLDWQSPRIRLEIHCGKGTYIRALARDIGALLGCGAYLSALTRIGCGPLTIESSVSLEMLERSADWRDHLLPMDFGLTRWPVVQLSLADTQRILNGMSVHDDGAPQALAAPHLRAYTPAGQFVAVVKHDPTHHLLRPEKVFPENIAA